VIVFDESETTPDFLHLNATALPRQKLHGKCQPIYPHSYPRVNNIFTVRTVLSSWIADPAIAPGTRCICGAARSRPRLSC
jgi:hypothetical protein